MNYSGSGLTQVCLVQQVAAATYTPTGLFATQTNADGTVTSFGYDAVGNETSVDQPDPATGSAGGPTTTYTYDALGRVTGETDPRGYSTGYAYQFYQSGSYR